MKVKLKSECELNQLNQNLATVLRMNGMDFNTIYEVLDDYYQCYIINHRVKTVRKDAFNIIEENMPTKEQIIEAASTSKEAKDALVKLFPQYFEDEKYCEIIKDEQITREFLCIRQDGKYTYKGFYLMSSYKWEILKDDKNELVLVPTKKL